MNLNEAKTQKVGSVVKDLDVVVTTAGKTEQVDKSLPLKQAEQQWEQKLGLTDTTDHIWAILPTDKYKPVVKGRNIIVKSAAIDEFTNKGGGKENRLIITKYETPTCTASQLEQKPKFEGILDPLIERILEKYDIAATEALWPCTRKNKKTGVVTTNWIIYHRYCEQIAAKAGIVFERPEIIVNEKNDKGKATVVLLVTGQLGYVKEWSYGEASPETTFLPYIFAMAEKRAKDRVILKLAGFHGMVYSESEWNNGKEK